VPPSSTAPRPQVPLIYLQTDPRWADERIGGSNEAIAEVGCTLCCIAMALEHHGLHLTPAELNAKLKAADGYTSRGWVKWHAVSTATGGAVRVEVPDEPSRERIDAALAAGCPVIAKVLLWRITPHWVLLVGKQGDDYVIKDPLGDGTSLERLAKYRSGIQAIRIVRSAGGAS
jgi:ABC-type bacteriocin/lantibiotic exporter with double-glycine peptidase domain